MDFSPGGVGRRGRCSEEEDWDWDFLVCCVLLLLCPNLKRPFSFWPNWEAEVLLPRVPFGEKVGLLDREVEEMFVIVVWAEWTIVLGPTWPFGARTECPCYVEGCGSPLGDEREEEEEDGEKT